MFSKIRKVLGNYTFSVVTSLRLEFSYQMQTTKMKKMRNSQILDFVNYKNNSTKENLVSQNKKTTPGRFYSLEIEQFSSQYKTKPVIFLF